MFQEKQRSLVNQEGQLARSSNILANEGYLARSCKMEVILQDLARVRLYCKKLARSCNITNYEIFHKTLF